MRYSHRLGRGAGLLCAITFAGCNSPDAERTGSTEQAVTSCITIQRGAHGSAQDAMLSNPPMASNFGQHPIVRVGGKDEGLFWFGVDAIPASAVVDRATLTLYVNGSASNAPINIHRATAPWDEETVSYASFDQAFALQPSAIVRPTSANAFKSVDVTSLVASWVNGSHPNRGMLLETSANAKTIFVSAEGATVAQRPALEICFSTPADHCAPNPCQNGASCSNEQDTYSCSCPAGFTGPNCETATDSCADHPCQNGGSCTGGAGSFTCTCAPGYTGATCETLTDNCAPNPCQSGGTCTNAVNSYTCACSVGFTGVNCETIVDSCAAGPCLNGGACTNQLETYVCACSAGYTGTNCEVVIDNCQAGLCHNGGTCVNQVNGFTCACAPGYTGANCETLIDNCASDPCENGGTCTNGVGSYTCACAPGYAGEHCEVDIDECASAPCQNGGLCIDEVDGFTCSCEAPYSGETCETTVCTGKPTTYVGFYTITNQASVDALECIFEITGSLAVQPGVAEIALPRLTRIGGRLDVDVNSVLTRLDLHSVRSIAADVRIFGNAALASIDLSALESAGGYVEITNNPQLSSIGSLAQLTSVVGTFGMQLNPLIPSVDVSNATLGGVFVSRNAALTSFRLAPLPSNVIHMVFESSPLLIDIGPSGLSGVQHVANRVGVIGTGLATLGPTGLSSLVSVGARVDINANPNLTTVGDLAQLTSVTRGFAMQNNPLITSIDIHNAVVGGFYMVGNSSMTSFLLPPMPAELSEAVIGGSPLLTDIGPTGFSGLQRVTGQLAANNTRLSSLGPTGLSSLTTIGTRIDINSNPLLTTLGNLAQLTSVGTYFVMQNNPLITNIDLSNAALGGFYLSNNPALTSFLLAPMPTQLNDAYISFSPLLTDIGPTGFSGLQRVAGQLGVSSTGLTNLGPTGLSSLFTVGTRMDIAHNPQLSNIGSLAQLQAVTTSSLVVQNNPLITSLQLSALTTLRDLYIANNAGLTSVELPVLPSLELSLLINGNNALTQIELPALGAVGVNFSISSNASLCNSIPVSIRAHATVGGATSIVNNREGC